jgi:PRC-barrel domain
MATLDTSASSARLIAGSRVSGTSVYDTSGQSLGTIEDVMIDKLSGRIAYAVMSFGGFLGIGSQHHPLPWTTLKYDTALGGYVVNLDRQMLEGAPAYSDDETADWEDRAWGQRVHDYYRAEPYWNVVP